MGNQPMYKMLYGKKSFDNCDVIDKFGIYLPCHDKLNEKDIAYVSEVVNSI